MSESPPPGATDLFTARSGKGGLYWVVYHYELGFLLSAEDIARLQYAEAAERAAKANPPTAAKKSRRPRQPQRPSWPFPDKTAVVKQKVIRRKPPPEAVNTGRAYYVPPEHPLPQPWDWKKATLGK